MWLNIITANINNCNVGDPWQTDKCTTYSDCAEGYQSDTDCSMFTLHLLSLLFPLKSSVGRMHNIHID